MKHSAICKRPEKPDCVPELVSNFLTEVKNTETKIIYWKVKATDFQSKDVFSGRQYLPTEKIIDLVTERLRSLGSQVTITSKGFLETSTFPGGHTEKVTVLVLTENFFMTIKAINKHAGDAGTFKELEPNERISDTP